MERKTMELTNKYYKQDLCNENASCKLYNALITQGQCEYYNKWCEQQQEIKELKKALDLMLSELKNYAKYVLEDYIVDSWEVEDFIEQVKENTENKET